MSSLLFGNGEEFPLHADLAVALTGYPPAARMTQGQGVQPGVCSGGLQTPGTNDVATQPLIEGYDDNGTS